MKRLFLLVAVTLLSGLTSSTFGQQWDNTGNGLLSGTYSFREILWVGNTPSTGNILKQVKSRYGTINFNGSGNYTITGTEWNSETNATTPYTPSDTYSISLGGYGFLNRGSDPLQRVYGLVSNGIFIGSSTESGDNNLFIAALPNSTPITNPTFNRNYTVTYTTLANPLTPNLAQIQDATFTLAPNGAGSLGTVNVSGYSGANTTPTALAIPGATYSFTGGVGTINLGAANTTDLISGSKQLYVSNAGNLIFGGSTTGADMFVGTLTPTAPIVTSVFDQLYFQAGTDVDRKNLPTGIAYVNSYYGSLSAVTSLNSMLAHQRVQTDPDPAYEYTYSDVYTLSSNGTFNDDFLGFRDFISADGSVRVGFGTGRYIGINVAVKAPPLTGSGVFLNPNGVVNAASYSPFTVGVSPGELLTLFGTNLANGTSQDSTFPNSLGGVAVTINGLQAPIYIATPTALAVLVPFGVSGSKIAEITVNNNGVTSNRVTAFVNLTSPGVFAGGPVPNGLGYPAARHTTRADQGIVTPEDPAHPGEYLAIFLTGLGNVNPAIATGALGPFNPLSITTSSIIPSVAGTTSNSNFAGIAPVQRGLYQINVQVPSNATPGNLFLEIRAPDALNSQIKIPVAAATGSALPEPRLAEPETSRSRPEPPHAPDSTRRGWGTTVDGSPSSDK